MSKINFLKSEPNFLVQACSINKHKRVFAFLSNCTPYAVGKKILTIIGAKKQLNVISCLHIGDFSNRRTSWGIGASISIIFLLQSGVGHFSNWWTISLPTKKKRKYKSSNIYITISAFMFICLGVYSYVNSFEILSSGLFWIMFFLPTKVCSSGILQYAL